jgi:hypothetical protein
MPKLDPPPAPGPESAAAEDKVMMGWVKYRGSSSEIYRAANSRILGKGCFSA